MLKRAEEFVIGFCVILITIIMNFNIVMRYVFNNSWTPTEEVCLILVVIITFVGSAYATRMGMHLFASFLFDLPNVPRKFKKLLVIVISAVSAVFCLILAFLAAQLVMQNYKSGRTTPSLGIPFYTFYITLPVSFVLMALHNARTLICNLRQKDYTLSPEKEVN